MSLYHEIPKDAIMGILRERFSEEELDIIRLDLYIFLLNSNSMADLQNKLYEAIKSKKASEDYRSVHAGNFISS